MRKIFIIITLFFLVACNNKAERLEGEKCGLVLDGFIAKGFPKFSTYTLEFVMLQQGSLSFDKFNPELWEYETDHKFLCKFRNEDQKLYLKGYMINGSNTMYGPDENFKYELLIAKAVNEDEPPATYEDVEELFKKPPLE